MNLPVPAGCNLLSTSSNCANVQLLNQLDGFNVNPRITVCFSDAIDTTTLTSGISINNLDVPGPPIGIDRVIYDPVANCAYAKPSQVLNQQTRYVLAVTSAVSDSGGKRLKGDSNFSDCIKKPSTNYCNDLSQAVGALNLAGNGNNLGDLVGASLFTTLSATNWLEQVRSQVDSGAIPGVGSLAMPMATFNLSDVQSITFKPQTGLVPVNHDQPVPLSVLSGVDRISFGLFLSPLYLNMAGPQAGTITTTPTNSSPTVPLVMPVSFHVFLPPASAVGSGKIPVIIYGHGLGDNQFGAATYAASTWAQQGFATLAIEITGHGYGAASFTEVAANFGIIPVPTPGRGVQLSLTAPIGPTDGCILPTAIGTRDCGRQTAVDLSALVRTIQNTQGLGLNLDPSRIYYTGQSFGAIYGTLFEAIDPGVVAGTLNGGGSQVDVARLSPVARLIGSAYLSGFSPSLLNVPPAPSQPYFHDNFNDEYVYNGQVVTDSVPGALAVQAAFEQAEWLNMLGDPLSYAGHLKTSPLAGVPPKPTLVQFGLGDLEVPNPAESALVRAGGLQNATWMLQTDVAAGMDPRLLSLMESDVPYPIYPHRFLCNPTVFDPASPPLETAIAVATQKQIADFFTSNGTTISDPNQYLTGPYAGRTVFQNPATLPDGLNFFQVQP